MSDDTKFRAVVGLTIAGGIYLAGTALPGAPLGDANIWPDGPVEIEIDSASSSTSAAPFAGKLWRYVT